MGRKNEQGFLLLDAVISLPILLLILTAVVTISFASIRHIYRAYAMEELRYEVQEVMLRIVEEMSTARQVEWGYAGDENGLQIFRRPYFTDETAVHTYFLHAGNHTQNIYFQEPDFPVTGKNDLATVQIVDFHMEEAGDGLYAVSIKGEVLQIGRTYELTAYVHVDGGDAP